ncbi:aliphatic sulfonate ABC transporter substrate-binding protein [soil metagenome]
MRNRARAIAQNQQQKVRTAIAGMTLMVLLSLLTIWLTACGATKAPSAEKVKVRLGYFPNVTHAPALIGIQRGDFAKALGDGASLETLSFNAGPSVIEAMFGGNLDIAYVGPSPTLNGFLKSEGKEVVVIAGAVDNGVLIVGNKKRRITSMAQLKGAKIATPQIGNTQDISAKYYVMHDLKSEVGTGEGKTTVTAVPNPDIENLFLKDQLDAAWVPEPWGSRMIESGLVVKIEEEKNLWPSKRFTLTNVIVRREFLEKHPDLVKKFLRAHVAITKELQANRESFVETINKQIENVTHKTLPAEVIASSLRNCEFSTEPDAASFTEFFEKGKQLKLLEYPSLDVAKLIDASLLKEVSAAP